MFAGVLIWERSMNFKFPIFSEYYQALFVKLCGVICYLAIDNIKQKLNNSSMSMRKLIRECSQFFFTLLLSFIICGIVITYLFPIRLNSHCKDIGSKQI